MPNRSIRRRPKGRSAPFGPRLIGNVRAHVPRTVETTVAHAELAWLSKRDLHVLAYGLLEPEPWVVERCVEFVLADNRGLWHGRARAMMCRRLKHCELGRTLRTALVARINGRLADGSFSEQFKDQLRLAMHLDLKETLHTARTCMNSSKVHVKRYAQWVS